MRITVSPVKRPIRSGTESRCSVLKLVGHGHNEELADESLARAIRAWAVGLQRAGRLERVLSTTDLDYDLSDPARIDVQIGPSGA